MVRATMHSSGVYNATATDITVNTTPVPALVNKNMFWYIEPWSTNCERLRVSSSTGQVLHLSQPTKIDHPDNSVVVCMTNLAISPHLYGSYQSVTPGRQFADDWRPLQRAIMDHQWVKWEVGFNYQGICTGRPLMLLDGTFMKNGWVNLRSDVWDWNVNQSGIPNDFPLGNSTTLKGCGGYSQFDARLDNRIILHDAPNLTVGQPVMLMNPHNEFLPGGILSGKHYLVQSWTPGTKTLYIAEITSPTVQLDITAAGRGHIFYDFTKPIEICLERMELRGSLNLECLQVCTKPTATTKDIRTFNGAVVMTGKGSYHQNCEVQLDIGLDSSWANYPAMYIEGEAHTFDYLNQNGSWIALRVGPSKGINIDMHYVEGTSQYGVDILPGCHGLYITQSLNNRAGNVAYANDTLGGRDTTYDLGPCCLQLTDHTVHQVGGVSITKTASSIWNWREGDFRYNVAGIVKTPDGVIVKHRVGSDQGSSGDEIWTHQMGKGQNGCTFSRSSGTLVMPDPTGLLPGKATTWWMHKISNAGAYPGGTVTITDHLNNTLYTFTLQELKFFRYMPPDAWAPYSVSYWHVSAT